LLYVSTTAMAETTAWRRDQVAKHQFQLVSDQRVEIYRFQPDGVVLMTFGKKGGPVTGLASRWKIEGDRLEIAGGLDRPVESFTLLKSEEAGVTVRRKSGVEAVFAVSLTR
jgi:hypothetical protein